MIIETLRIQIEDLKEEIRLLEVKIESSLNSEHRQVGLPLRVANLRKQLTAQENFLASMSVDSPPSP